MHELKIIPMANNIILLKIKDIELKIYCSDGNYVSIENKGKIEYPEIIDCLDLEDKDSVKFYPKK